MYVDSLRVFAANSPTGVVAQLGARWIALLHFLGSNRIPAGEFFSILYLFLSFVLKFVFHFETFSFIQKNIKAK